MKISGHVDNTEAIRLPPVIGESVTTKRAGSGILISMVRIKGQKSLTDDEKRDIVHRYVDGATIKGLAGEYHRSDGTIRSIIVVAGVPIKARGFGDPRVQKPALAARGIQPLSDDEKDNIARRYADGENVRNTMHGIS